MNANCFFARATAVTVVCFVFLFNTAGAQTEVVPLGATWAYFDDLTRAANQYPNNEFAWNSFEYDPSPPPFGEWTVGDAPFASAAIGAFTGPVSALDAPAPNEAAVLFRTEFSADGNLLQASTAHLNLVCDDGCVAYLNGAEFFRLNLLEGAVQPNTSTVTIGDENSYRQFVVELPDGALRLGRNTLAVEVHNFGENSSDLGFDMSLAIETPPIPEPATGVLAALLALMLFGIRANRASTARARAECGEG